MKLYNIAKKYGMRMKMLDDNIMQHPEYPILCQKITIASPIAM